MGGLYRRYAGTAANQRMGKSAKGRGTFNIAVKTGTSRGKRRPAEQVRCLSTSAQIYEASAECASVREASACPLQSPLSACCTPCWARLCRCRFDPFMLTVPSANSFPRTLVIVRVETCRLEQVLLGHLDHR
jgi:hypothetical protein